MHGLLKFMDCFYGPTPFYLATLANNLGGRVSLRNIHVLAALPRRNFCVVLSVKTKCFAFQHIRHVHRRFEIWD